MFVEHVDELFLGNATSKLSEKYPKLLLAFAEISWIVCEISKPPKVSGDEEVCFCDSHDERLAGHGAGWQDPSQLHPPTADSG